VVLAAAAAIATAPGALASNDLKVKVGVTDDGAGAGWSYVPPQNGTWKTGTGRDRVDVVESGSCDGLPAVKSTGIQQICNMTNPSSPALSIGWTNVYLPAWTITSPSGIDHAVSRYDGWAASANVGYMKVTDESTTQPGKVDVSTTFVKSGGVYNWVVTVPDGALRDLAAKDEVAVAAASARVLSTAAVLGSSQCQQVTLNDGESFRGTAGSDCVKIDVAADANVTVNMLGGSDTVAVTVPDGSSAEVDLGASNDTLVVTGGGDATVKGGHGDDVIVMGNGDDDVKAGPGADFVVGSGGKDEIRGAESSARGNVRGLDGLAAVR